MVLVENARKPIIGFMPKAMADTGPLAILATSYGFCIAIRFGTSSPNINVKYDRIMVITITETVSSALTGKY